MKIDKNFLFDYQDPELLSFYRLGSNIINLETLQVDQIGFSAFETSSGTDDLDYPFEAKVVTLRPGFWYALNLSVGGESKTKIVKIQNELENFVKSNFGSYIVSFVIVLPPGAKIPEHRHFREQSSLVFCIPSKPNEKGLQIDVNGEKVYLKHGYIHFDSRKMHSAVNVTDSTYWIFVFENVQSKINPRLETVEL